MTNGDSYPALIAKVINRNHIRVGVKRSAIPCHDGEGRSRHAVGYKDVDKNFPVISIERAGD
jgi:hypothetical protein